MAHGRSFLGQAARTMWQAQRPRWLVPTAHGRKRLRRPGCAARHAHLGRGHRAPRGRGGMGGEGSQAAELRRGG
jgi:hypothetical protein